MNIEDQDIRKQFLALACQYLFGAHVCCQRFAGESQAPVSIRNISP